MEKKIWTGVWISNRRKLSLSRLSLGVGEAPHGFFIWFQGLIFLVKLERKMQIMDALPHFAQKAKRGNYFYFKMVPSQYRILLITKPYLMKTMDKNAWFLFRGEIMRFDKEMTRGQTSFPLVWISYFKFNQIRGVQELGDFLKYFLTQAKIVEWYLSLVKVYCNTEAINFMILPWLFPKAAQV